TSFNIDVDVPTDSLHTQRGAHTKRSTHLLTGVAVGAAASVLLDGELVLLLVGGVAGMLPDLDLLLVPLLRRAHRSPWSHSLGASLMTTGAWLAILLVVARWIGLEPIYQVSVSASAAVVFIASFLHSVEDALTRYGCQLLHPLSRRIYRGPFRYDDMAANAVLLLLSLILIMLSMLGNL
ncbi:MAG: metal-dependent hydrolase, partial [Methanobacteriota archaeon]